MAPASCASGWLWPRAPPPRGQARSLLRPPAPAPPHRVLATHRSAPPSRRPSLLPDTGRPNSRGARRVFDRTEVGSGEDSDDDDFEDSAARGQPRPEPQHRPTPSSSSVRGDQAARPTYAKLRHCPTDDDGLYLGKGGTGFKGVYATQAGFKVRIYAGGGVEETIGVFTTVGEAALAYAGVRNAREQQGSERQGAQQLQERQQLAERLQEHREQHLLRRQQQQLEEEQRQREQQQLQQQAEQLQDREQLQRDREQLQREEEQQPNAHAGVGAAGGSDGSSLPATEVQYSHCVKLVNRDVQANVAAWLEEVPIGQQQLWGEGFDAWLAMSERAMWDYAGAVSHLFRVNEAARSEGARRSRKRRLVCLLAHTSLAVGWRAPLGAWGCEDPLLDVQVVSLPSPRQGDASPIGSPGSPALVVVCPSLPTGGLAYLSGGGAQAIPGGR